MRNTSLHKARIQTANRIFPTWLGRGWVPPSKAMLKILPFPSGSTGLTELPAFPSWETPAAPLSHANTGAHFHALVSPQQQGPSMPPPDLGTLQLGQRTQAKAGRTQGLFWAREQPFTRTGGRGACT